MTTAPVPAVPRAPFDAEAALARLEGQDGEEAIDSLEAILEGLTRTLAAAQG